jgi:hypothetical protein
MLMRGEMLQLRGTMYTMSSIRHVSDLPRLAACLAMRSYLAAVLRREEMAWLNGRWNKTLMPLTEKTCDKGLSRAAKDFTRSKDKLGAQNTEPS